MSVQRPDITERRKSVAEDEEYPTGLGLSTEQSAIGSV